MKKLFLAALLTLAINNAYAQITAHDLLNYMQCRTHEEFADSVAKKGYLLLDSAELVNSNLSAYTFKATKPANGRDGNELITFFEGTDKIIIEFVSMGESTDRVITNDFGKMGYTDKVIFKNELKEIKTYTRGDSDITIQAEIVFDTVSFITLTKYTIVF